MWLLNVYSALSLKLMKVALYVMKWNVTYNNSYKLCVCACVCLCLCVTLCVCVCVCVCTYVYVEILLRSVLVLDVGLYFTLDHHVNCNFFL